MQRGRQQSAGSGYCSEWQAACLGCHRVGLGSRIPGPASRRPPLALPSGPRRPPEEEEAGQLGPLEEGLCPQPHTGGRGRCKQAAAHPRKGPSLIPKFCPHPRFPTLLSHLLIGTLPEDAQDEDCSHWRGQGAGHRLHVDEELPTIGALQDWDPGHAYANEHHDDQPVGRKWVCLSLKTLPPPVPTSPATRTCSPSVPCCSSSSLLLSLWSTPSGTWPVLPDPNLSLAPGCLQE